MIAGGHSKQFRTARAVSERENIQIDRGTRAMCIFSSGDIIEVIFPSNFGYSFIITSP